MAFNGSGTYVLTAGQPVVAGTDILDSTFNTLTADLATALSTCVTRDGQSPPTTNLPMGSFKLTGLSAGTASGHSVRFEQLQTGVNKLITVAGTGDVITGVMTPTYGAYTNGDMFTFIVGSTNTTNVTINIDGLGAKAITNGTTALTAGALTANRVVVIQYDGTRFQLLNSYLVAAAGANSDITSLSGLTTPLTEAQGGTGTTTGYYGFKNRIINGAMVIDQRNAGASVTPTINTFTLDRWIYPASQASKISIQQNAGAITPPIGFGNYLGVTSLSAYSVLSTDYFILQQAIEGFNTSDLAFGTANAKSVTLSFQVYSSLTGTFGGGLGNSADNRSYPFSYSIPVANTWTTISITIAGDVSGTWIGATNGIGLVVRFSLGAGSNPSNTAGSWATGAYYSATGATSVVGTNGATFYITGVQLEKGSTATSFDYRPYGTELDLCQRYYVGTNSYWFTVGYDPTYPTENRGGLSWSYQMRITPSMSITAGGMAGHHGTPPAAGSIAYYGVYLYFGGAACRPNVSTSASVDFNLTAEL